MNSLCSALTAATDSHKSPDIRAKETRGCIRREQRTSACSPIPIATMTRSVRRMANRSCSPPSGMDRQIFFE
jgi:hypothetical protein